MDAKQYGDQPAFPFGAYEEEIRVKPTQHSGFTKREEILKAVIGPLAAVNERNGIEGGEYQPFEFVAARAARYADAVLAELAKDGAL